jgi:deazaflavin-dependent oxidoreductase (nitroreductase family)
VASLQLTIMRTLSRITVALYRATGGRIGGRMGGVPVLLLTVAGRRTGVAHTTSVSYFLEGDRYVVTGSAGGSPKEPQWFRNLRAASAAQIEVGPRKLAVSVSIAEGAERDALWQKLLTHAPSFAAYQAKVERQIPMAVLAPKPDP